MQMPFHTDQCVRGWGCHPACQVNQMMKERAELQSIIQRFVDLDLKSAAFKAAVERFQEWKARHPNG